MVRYYKISTQKSLIITRHMNFFRELTFIALLLLPVLSVADTIRLAVASNFSLTMRVLIADFEKNGGSHLEEGQEQYKVLASYSSTGKHFAQIYNKAPFDIFFSADKKRPELLEEHGLVVSGSRFTYAIGKLVLWSPGIAHVNTGGEEVLKGNRFKHIAVANPKLAPYGRASQQVLTALNLWQSLQGKLVRGENISQTFQFVASGNAEIGIVAASQVNHFVDKSSYWHIPESLHQPIEQQAVLLQDSVAARSFFDYMRTEKAARIIRSMGYQVP